MLLETLAHIHRMLNKQQGMYLEYVKQCLDLPNFIDKWTCAVNSSRVLS